MFGFVELNKESCQLKKAQAGTSLDGKQNPWECYVGSCVKEPSTLEDAGTEHRRARFGSYGGVGLETVWSNSNGEVKVVQTSKNTIHSKKAVIVAVGCWTGSLIHDLFRNSGMDLHVPVMPREVCLCTD
ncbi:hypothetical protein JHK86_001235 [Glycine max]|nr:hypothetical protein JHK86_001235 [Glycine max]